MNTGSEHSTIYVAIIYNKRRCHRLSTRRDNVGVKIQPVYISPLFWYFSRRDWRPALLPPRLYRLHINLDKIAAHVFPLAVSVINQINSWDNQFKHNTATYLCNSSRALAHEIPAFLFGRRFTRARTLKEIIVKSRWNFEMLALCFVRRTRNDKAKNLPFFRLFLNNSCIF